MRTSLVGCRIPHANPAHICIEGPLWAQNTMPDARYVAAVYGQGKFWAGGSDGSNNVKLAYSSDGVTWALSATPPSFPAGPSPIISDCLAYGNGTFVAFGNFIEGAYSFDGVTWIGYSTSSFAKTYLYFASGVFLCVSASSSSIHRSIDGHNWSSKTLTASLAWSSVAYGGGRFIVAANDGTTNKSDDGGLTWSAHGALPANYQGRLAYGNGVWVVLGSSSNDGVAYSIDGGATWTAVPISGATVVLTDITFQQGVFLVVNDGGSIIHTSTDGVTWNTPANVMPAPLTGFTQTIFDGVNKYAAIQRTNPGTTIGASGSCT